MGDNPPELQAVLVVTVRGGRSERRHTRGNNNCADSSKPANALCGKEGRPWLLNAELIKFFLKCGRPAALAPNLPFFAVCSRPDLSVCC